MIKMASSYTVIGGDVGIRLANDVNVDDIQDPSDTGDISSASYMGAIRDKSGSCTTYEKIIGCDGIDISDIAPVRQVISPTGTVHDIRIHIKDSGKGSFTVPMYVMNSVLVVDGHQLLWAAENLPDGVTGTIGSGSPGTADEAAEYVPWDDTTTNYGFGDGYMGYNILVESSYTNSAGETKYDQHFFDNCRITPSTSINAQEANTVTIEFEARRYRHLTEQASTLIAEETLPVV
jgi:hypothetical protein